jgi:non-ribosomal peptide synthetase component E (peptide arylation enzyme)
MRKAGCIPETCAENVLGALREQIASFKLPARVYFERTFPMTPLGKVRKVELRMLARERLGFAE